MTALSMSKQKCLGRGLTAESPASRMSLEGRREALAEALAEGIVYSGERGLLPLAEESFLGRPAQAVKAKSPNEKSKRRSP